MCVCVCERQRRVGEAEHHDDTADLLNSCGSESLKGKGRAGTEMRRGEQWKRKIKK